VKDERGPGLDFALCFVYVCIKHIIKHMYQINAALASIKDLFLKHNKFFLTLNFWTVWNITSLQECQVTGYIFFFHITVIK